jgi:guanylate kinase
MYKIIALMGEAGSGKDALMKKILKHRPDFHEIISCTSRPMRQGEQHGVNYYYYTDEEFADKINYEEMLEFTIFNNWFYGTGYDSVKEDKINIGVFNPTGVRLLLQREDVNLKIFRICAEDKTRLLRQLNREENPNVREVVRRFMADYEDFDNLEDIDYISINNGQNSDLDAGAQEILFWIEQWLEQGQK